MPSIRLARFTWLWLLLLTTACDPSNPTPDVGLKSGQVAGLVRLDDADTAAGATVTVQDTGTTGTTGADGRFTLKDLSPGLHTLVVRTPHYREASETVEVKASETASVTFVLQRERGGIAGTLQLEGGASTQGASVELTGTGLQTQADAQGYFAFTGVPTGTYTLRARKETYTPAEGTVEVGVDAQAFVTLSLRRERGGVTGVVQLEDSARAADIPVRLVGTAFNTRTDAEGRFTFEGVPTGTYTLRIQRDGYVQHEQQVEVHAGTQASVTQTLLRERGSVAGRIQLEGEGNSAGIAVALVDTEFATLTDAEGRFTLTGILPGTYTLRAGRERFFPYEQQVEVRAGAQSSVAQTLLRERGTVMGTLLLEGGVSASNVEVVLVGTDSTTRTNEDGVFALTGVPTGTYTLRAQRTDYVRHEQQVEVRTNAQTSVSGLLARARGAIAGRVLLEGGESAQGLTVVASGAETWGTTTDAEGRFTLGGLPTGAYTLSTRKDHHARAQTLVEVREDASAAAELTLARLGAPTVIVPKLAVQRGYLELTGSDFGEQRGESHVSVGGVEASDYISWSDTRVVVRVPASVKPGPRDVVLKPGPAWRPAATVSLRVVRQQTLATSQRDWNLGVTPENTVTGWGPSAPVRGERPAGLSDVVSVAVGEYFGLALKADGTVIEWGEYPTPQTTMPAGLSGVVAISASSNIAAALLRDGTVVAWGGLEFERTKVPPGLQDVVALSVSQYWTVALKADGTVVTWGKNVYGEVSIPPADLSGVTAVGGTALSSAAVLADGSLRGWDFGAGHNGYENVTDPVGFMDVRGGYDVLVALRQDGTLRAWGRNDYGQASPPATLTGVVDAMPMGTFDGVALLQDGTLKTWGVSVQFRLPPAGLVLRVAPR